MAAGEGIRAEALRYMGYKSGDTPAAPVEAAMERCFAALAEAATFADTRHAFALAIEGGVVMLAGLHIHSQSLATQLEGCSEAMLYAATLGAQVDRLMQRASSTDMSEAVVLQACAAALLEQQVDAAMELLSEEYATHALYLRPRFSPGYGDFSLEHQRGILRILDTGRRIGLGCTQSSMLAPTKSITAVIGISPRPPHNATAPCEGCELAHCAYKKE